MTTWKSKEKSHFTGNFATWHHIKVHCHKRIATNRSLHNVQVEWKNGEMTDEPFNIIAEDAPVACAVHAKKNNLLNQPGWKQFKRWAQRHGRFFTEAKKAKT